MAVNPGTGWSMTPFGTPESSTMQGPLSPSQVQQIQQMTSTMGGQTNPASPQQNQMMTGLFGPQNNLGQNLGSMGQSLWGGSPSFGGGNMLSGDAYGGSAAAPLPGLTMADYG